MMVRALLFLVVSSALAPPALAQDCRLALVLALDVSGSVDATEDRLQREGLAQAMLAPEVRQAFLMGGPVALYVFEWSNAQSQRVLLQGWQMIGDDDDLTRVATGIAALPRGDGYRLKPPTAVGSALVHAAEALHRGPDCAARTIDIAGDGENNEGLAPADAYAARSFEGVTVNALVIAGAYDGIDPDWDDRRLVAWFEAEVLQGPDAFWILADGYEDYARAMELKLLRELELPLVSGWPIGNGS